MNCAVKIISDRPLLALCLTVSLVIAGPLVNPGVSALPLHEEKE